MNARLVRTALRHAGKGIRQTNRYQPWPYLQRWPLALQPPKRRLPESPTCDASPGSSLRNGSTAQRWHLGSLLQLLNPQAICLAQASGVRLAGIPGANPRSLGVANVFIGRIVRVRVVLDRHLPVERAQVRIAADSESRCA